MKKQFKITDDLIAAVIEAQDKVAGEPVAEGSDPSERRKKIIRAGLEVVNQRAEFNEAAEIDMGDFIADPGKTTSEAMRSED